MTNNAMGLIVLVLALLLVHCDQLQYTRKGRLQGIDGDFVGYSPSNKYLLSISGKEIKFYDRFKENRIRMVHGRQPVTCYCMSADDTLLAIGTSEGNVQIINATSGVRSSPTQVSPNQKINTMTFSKNTKSSKIRLAVGIRNKVAVLRISQRFSIQKQIEKQFDGQVNSLDWSPTGMLLVGGGNEVTQNILSIVDPIDNFRVITYLPSTKVTQDAKYSQDGSIIVRVGGANYMNIDVFDVRNNYQKTSYKAENQLFKVMISPDKMSIIAITEASVQPFQFQKGTSSNIQKAYSPQTVFSISADSSNKVSLSAGGQLIIPQAEGNIVYSLCEPKREMYSFQHNICIGCQSQCLVCEGATDRCFQCQSAHYYLDSDTNKCKPCIDGCFKCKNGNTCTTCKDTGHYVKNTSNQCQCQENYFNDTQSMSCKQCQWGCLRCNVSLTCETCDSQHHFVRNSSGRCECKPGYGETNKVCKKCDGAKKWVRSPSSGKCVCEAGFFENKNECVSCVYGCIKCANSKSCQVCDNAKHLTKGNNNQCVCGYGYYKQQHVCKACSHSMLGCLECHQSRKCLTCTSDFELKDTRCIRKQKQKQSGTSRAVPIAGEIPGASTNWKIPWIPIIMGTVAVSVFGVAGLLAL